MAPRVTVFSTIANIGQELVRAVDATKSAIAIDIITDAALNDGIDLFDPSHLQEDTRQVLLETEILITEPALLARLFDKYPSCLPCLKWCQSTFAGVDALFSTSFFMAPLPFRLTRFAGTFGPPIAEWCLARIIEHERKFALTHSLQLDKKWASNQVRDYRYLRDLTLTILGCGDIGMCIARAAKAFGMRIVGYAKTLREPTDGIDEYTTDLSTALSKADYIVSVLPSTPETKGLLAGNTLSVASRDVGGKCPVFLNVGRGDVIDEASLIHALDQGYISAAILDVFEKEPLPEISALWTRSDVVVSPHVSGVTHARDVPAVFLNNYQRYVNGDELLHVVDWSKGY